MLDTLNCLHFSENNWLMRLQKPAWDIKSFDDDAIQRDSAENEEQIATKSLDDWFSLSYQVV